jgi:hypothetical protein
MLEQEFMQCSVEYSWLLNDLALCIFAAKIAFGASQIGLSQVALE